MGKGPSLENMKPSTFRNGMVININDSYLIHQGEVVILNKDSAAEKANADSFYIKSSDIFLDPNQYKFVDLEQSVHNDELIIHRLNQEEAYLEDPLFLTALKVSHELSKNLNKELNVYMLGFDFNFTDMDHYTSPKLDQSQNESIEFKKSVLFRQESIFKQLVHYFQSSQVQDKLKIIHVGDKNFSEMSISDFNIKFAEIKVQEEVTPETETRSESGVEIVAEITTNHLGSRDRLIEMVELAKDAGADYVKVQKRNVETFYTPDQLASYYHSNFGETLRDYRNGLELNLEDFKVLDDTCKRLNIKWFASILDFESFEFLSEFKPDLIKIPSTISNHTDFHDKIAESYNGKLVVSTGFTDKDYESYLINRFSNMERLYLLQCVSSYPTKDEDCNVAVVRHYYNLAQKYPNIIPGYSSHDIGSTGCMLAVAAGAKMIEKHVKLGDNPWVHFDSVAIDLKNDFKKFVDDVRRAEMFCGSEEKKILKSEHHKYKVNKS